MADEFVQGPGVEAFLAGFVGKDVVGAEGVEAVGQLREGAGVGAGVLAAQALDEKDVEALAFDGQFQLQFYPPGAADEEVGQGDAKQAVPGGGGEGRLGELGVDGASRVANRARGGRIEYAKANKPSAS